MYTPYEMPKGASADEIAKHAGERAFYDMTGADNIFKYITTEGKRTGKFTALEYLQKNTGVFNDKGTRDISGTALFLSTRSSPTR